MSINTEQTAIRHQITVEVPLAQAFEVFTQRFDEIKPRQHKLLPVEIAETVLEARAGGAIYDRGVDGTRCQWGRVLAVDPPNRLLFSWDISPQWQVQSDPALASEVEISFTAITDASTSVVLEHRHLDRHGPGWTAERDAVDGDQGWPLYLAAFEAALGLAR